MLSTSALLLALVVALALGFAASAHLWTVRRRQAQAGAGIRALSGMRWREFSHFVLDAMKHRGYDLHATHDEGERGQETEFLLSKGGQRWLLSCKHGSAYRIAEPAVAELAGSIRFRGAHGGLLVTPGQIEPAARKAATAADIELLDGAALWPEIAPLLPQTLRDELQQNADARAKRQIGLAWLGALALGLVLAVLGGRDTGIEARPDPVAAITAPATPAALAASTPATLAPAPAATPAQEDQNRQSVMAAVSDLPGVDRALWSTRSTLLVHLGDESVDRLTEICAVLERYPELCASRVQLQPPQGSTQRVRFRQCRTY